MEIHDSERSRLFYLQIFAVQVPSSGQEWAGRNYLGDSSGLNAHGVRRGFSEEHRGWQWVLFPRSGKWAEAEENSAAGDLVPELQGVNKWQWVREQRWKNLRVKGYMPGVVHLMVSSDLLQWDQRNRWSFIAACPAEGEGSGSLLIFWSCSPWLQDKSSNWIYLLTERKPKRGVNS